MMEKGDVVEIIGHVCTTPCYMDRPGEYVDCVGLKAVVRYLDMGVALDFVHPPNADHQYWCTGYDKNCIKFWEDHI